MKHMTLVTTVVLSGLLALPASAGRGAQSYIDQAVLSICVETAQNDRLGLIKTLRAYSISKENAVTKVVCNAKPLVAFARAEQADKIVRMLAPVEARVKGHVTIQELSAAP